MDNVKNDLYYIRKLKDDMEFIVRHTKHITLEELHANEILLDSMLFRLIQISESAKKLSDDYKNNHPHIPWTAVYGLRNRIVHDYGSVDLGIVYSTLKKDIPDLLEDITRES
ncbi:MAG: DUF86 domain-containing protein [Acidaminococcaceae bacterium]|nr:DUF86 domain-containing protein [Acidaminococcaceae bacterium]